MRVYIYIYTTSGSPLHTLQRVPATHDPAGPRYTRSSEAPLTLFSGSPLHSITINVRHISERVIHITDFTELSLTTNCEHV